MPSGYTEIYPVTNVVEVNVVAHVYCQEIRVSENWTAAVGPTTGFLVKKAGTGSTGADQIAILIGAEYVFRKPSTVVGREGIYGYKAGEVAGTIQLPGPTVTADFQQDES